MATLKTIWRHPIKGVGRETLPKVSLIAGQTMPMDRHWAIAHQDAKLDPTHPEWARCINFARAARGHRLMAVNSHYDDATGLITLDHPDLETITINPNDDRDAKTLIDWVTRISNPDRALPAYVTSIPDRGMTDSATPTLSIHALATLDDLSKRCGIALDQRRFRGNLWVEGWEAWSELDLIGKTLRIGEAELYITEPIERCMATTVNPDTGISDAPTLDVLRRDFGHINFGIFAKVTKSGCIRLDDRVEVIS